MNLPPYRLTRADKAVYWAFALTRYFTGVGQPMPWDVWRSYLTRRAAGAGVWAAWWHPSP